MLQLKNCLTANWWVSLTLLFPDQLLIKTDGLLWIVVFSNHVSLNPTMNYVSFPYDFVCAHIGNITAHHRQRF